MNSLSEKNKKNIDSTIGRHLHISVYQNKQNHHVLHVL